VRGRVKWRGVPDRTTAATVSIVDRR
jgi:hypothetical protein